MDIANKRSLATHKRRPLISLTPLVDVVFILLIFFMLASSFSREQSITMMTSQATTQAAHQGKPGAVLVRIYPDGRVDINGQGVSELELVKQIAAWSVEERPRVYLLQPSVGVSVQQTVTMIDLIRSAGGENVSLTRKGGL